MTRQIELTQGKVALVDDEDYEWLSQWKWYAAPHRGTSYVHRNSPRPLRQCIHMHREILGLSVSPDDGVIVDHIDGNGLNNVRDNLRICSRQENLFNRAPQSNNTSGYKGVSWMSSRNKWHVRIKAMGKDHYIGLFADLEEAARAYDDAAKKLHGEFAYLNFPQED